MKTITTFRQKQLCLLIAILFVLLSVLLLTGCEEKPQADAPLLWQVTAENGATIYLFGSIHVGSEDLYPLPERIMSAYEESDYLAVEVDLVAFEEDTAAMLEIASKVAYTDGSTVIDVIGGELYNQAMPIFEQNPVQIPASMLQYCKPYMWISLLQDIACQKAGLTATLGLDYYFLGLAKESNKQIIEIESIEEQLDLFSSFSDQLNQAMISSYLDLDAATAELNQLYQAWRIGDAEALLGMLYADVGEEAAQEVMEEYYQLLISSRNITMTDAAEQYLADGKKVFYVVGAFHLIGEDGIVAQLQDRGYTVEQID